ncbi:MAG: gamma carbonic anhydrase family protein [Gammaproteobacteria bacterium]
MPIRDFQDHTPNIAATAYVDATALVIGDVVVAEDASLWPMVVVRGDIHSIEIGARTNIQDSCVLHVTHDGQFSPGGNPLRIGADVTVGHRVILHGCTVEDRCLIGMGSVVLDGARVCSGAMVGAGSLVTSGKELEGGFLWLGSPARRVRPLTKAEQQFLEYSVHHYVELKNQHMAQY